MRRTGCPKLKQVLRPRRPFNKEQGFSMTSVRRYFMGAVFATATVLQAADRPNIIFIFCDDLGYGDVGALNAESKIPTPNMDRLAAEGMTFRDGHCSAASCTPSRYAALTGRYSWRTALKSGVIGGFSENLVEPDRATVASVLKGSGYRTAAFGKWHLGMKWPVQKGRRIDKNSATLDSINWEAPIENGPCTVGFDRYFGISASLDMPPYTFIEDDHVTAVPDTVLSGADFKSSKFGRKGPGVKSWRNEDVMPTIVNHAIDYIKASDGKQPFYLYLPLNAPHTPHVPSRDFLGKSEIGLYGDFVMEVDYHIGRVMQALDDAGLAENTLILFSSDNGPERNMYATRAETGHDSSGPLLGAKRDTWEGGHRVPFLVRWPASVKPGSKCDQPVSLVDWPATCAELAGASYGKDDFPDSISFASALRGEVISGNGQRIYVYRGSKGGLAFRQGDWKLLTHEGSGGNTYTKKSLHGREFEAYDRKAQLYNIKNDPYETANVYDQHPEVVERIREAGIQVIKQGRTTPGDTLPNTDYPWPQLDWM